MSRDASGRAQDIERRDMSLSKTYGAQGQQTYGQLLPIYTKWATNPQGMTQQERADATTTAMQGAGGAVAGAVGQGNLEAARTGNVGGYGAAIRDAARQGVNASTEAALRTSLADTAMKERQREQGVEGLQTLNTQQTGFGLRALDQATPAVNAETEAGKSGWFQNYLGYLNAMTGAQNAAKKG